MTNMFNGVNGNSFSSICLSGNNFIKTHIYSDTAEIYSIEVWNRALSESEIRTKEEPVSRLVFSLEHPDL